MARNHYFGPRRRVVPADAVVAISVGVATVKAALAAILYDGASLHDELHAF